MMMKKCKINYTLALFFLLSIPQVWAQTGINTTTPNDATRLHVEGQNKGILIPRVNLSGRNTATPLEAAPPEGTLVFNLQVAGTGDNKVFEGYYVWINGQWQRPLDSETVLSPIVKYTQKYTSGFTGNFNVTPEIMIPMFANEAFSYDETGAFTKLNDNELMVNETGTYQVTLNLGLQNNPAVQDNGIEIYVKIYLDGVEQQRVLSRVPQWRDGSSVDMQGRFDIAFDTYVQASAGQNISVRSVRNNTSNNGNGTIVLDTNAVMNESSITVIKIK